MIRIMLNGDPGHRTGAVTIDSQTWQLATWFRQADGHIQSTTDDGQQVTFAVDRDKGSGRITIGQTRWLVWDGRWSGATFTGRACLAVSDVDLAKWFGGWP